METIKIPRYVDELPQMALWEIDEAMLVFLSISFGVLIKQLIIFTALGFGIAYVFGRFKQGQARGLLMHYLHYNGLIPFKGYVIDFSYKKEWMY